MSSILFLHAAAYYVCGGSLALVLAWFGIFKFTPTEATAIEELVRNSPFMRGLYQLLSVRATARLIGSVELLTAVGLVVGWWWPPAGVAGGGLASLIFLGTSTFLLSSPGMFERVDGLWVPSDEGGFVIKDLLALGAALFCTAYALLQMYPTL